MQPIDARLIAQFNHAAALGRSGAHADAHAEYRALVDACTAPGAVATAEFAETARMRAAFCAMDLGRYAEAAEELARVSLAALDDNGRYEVHFARGNALGRLGRLTEAFCALVEAISCAEEVDIADESRIIACWSSIFAHGTRAADTEFVRDKAAIALNTARLRGFSGLAVLADLTLKGRFAELQ